MKLVRQESVSLVLFELTTLRSSLECQVPIFPFHLPVCQGRGWECCRGVKTQRVAQGRPHRGRPETSVNYLQDTEAVCPKRGGVVGVYSVTHAQRGQHICDHVSLGWDGGRVTQKVKSSRVFIKSFQSRIQSQVLAVTSVIVQRSTRAFPSPVKASYRRRGVRWTE